MEAYHVKIAFWGDDGAPQLEVTVPERSVLELRLWAVLQRERVVPSASYIVRAGDRLIARTKLLEPDGLPVSKERAASIINAVRACLEGSLERAPVHEDRGPPTVRAAR